MACNTATVVRLEELRGFAEALVCLQVGAALLIPWGLAIQAVAGLASLLAYLAAMTLLGGRDVGNLADLLWILCAGALACLATHLLERTRRALFCHRVRDREIVSSFSHDIRAPASAISMQTNLVDELSQDEEIRSRMHAIRASATQVLNLAQNMVDSIRIEEGKMTLRPERVDLNDLVSETVLGQESLARVKRVDVALELSPGLPPVHSDPLQLKRVIINLLSNGLNVTPAGGRVVLSTGMASDWVKISVKDGGPAVRPSASSCSRDSAASRADTAVESAWACSSLKISLRVAAGASKLKAFRATARLFPYCCRRECRADGGSRSSSEPCARFVKS